MHNSIYENLYITFVFTVAFSVATSQLTDSSIADYFSHRTIVLNEVRQNSTFDGIIHWVEGVMAGVVTLIFKPSIDRINSVYIQPFIKKKLSDIKKWHDRL